MKVMIFNPPSKHAKNVVRDLFYGCWCKGKRIASASFPPTTLLYVYSVLKKDNNNVVLFDAQSEGKTLDKTMKRIEVEKPEILLITTSTMTFKEDVAILREIKKRIDVVTMAFGSHVTFRPKDSLKEEGIDFLVMREPEYIIRDFVRKRRKGKNGKNVKGLAYRTKDSIKINPPYPFIKNLDEMPFPDRSPILNIEYFNPLVRKLPWTTLLTSRGCPGRCLFCSSPSFYGNALRMRSAESVLDELEEIEKLGYREVFFRDETFTSDPKRLKEICEGIKKRGIKLSWICNARIGNVNKDSMKLMKEAGCHMIKFGVESGSQKILDNINKMIKVDMTRLTFKWAHEVGMDLHAHMMLGCIGETKETIRQTINFLKEIEPTTVTCAAFTPYPGTKVFGIVEKKYPEVGDGSACDLSKLHTSGFYNDAFCDLSDKEVGEAVKRLYREFYFRPKYIFKRLASIRSLDDLRRIVSAGLDVISFSVSKEE